MQDAQGGGWRWWGCWELEVAMTGYWQRSKVRFVGTRVTGPAERGSGATAAKEAVQLHLQEATVLFLVAAAERQWGKAQYCPYIPKFRQVYTDMCPISTQAVTDLSSSTVCRSLVISGAWYSISREGYSNYSQDIFHFLSYLSILAYQIWICQW